LKRRFLLTIGLVLATAIGSVGILQYILFRSEQYRLIDSRIEATATLLLSSELSRADLKDFDEAENIVSEVVGGDRFNQFIIIYKRTGEEIYRSSNAEILPTTIPRDEKWQTIEIEGHFIRVLTLPLARPRPGKHPSTLHDTRILQTGLILDQDLLRMKTLSRHVIIYSVMILALILLTTFWLAEALLRPLKELALYLRHMSSRLEVSPDMSTSDMNANEPPVPPIRGDADDEFGQLVNETQRLRDMIGRGLKNTQAWTAQMAHEMKTPLTILQNSLERARAATDAVAREATLKEATDEISHLNSLISSFLEWSAAENFPELAEDLHAVRLGQVTRDLFEKFERQTPGRLKLEGDSTLRVFAKRGFAHQAISNLATNAVKYSPAGSVVVMRVRADRIEIIDDGPGLPPHVVDHLGEPFNYGSKDLHGFGLGLAWVRTICRKYGWNLSFERRLEASPLNATPHEMTVATISFPPEEM
jgi:signal transduction histidine kinase